MPKSSKAKKEKKADFQKTKLKLGKGAKQAANATSTAFQARSVGLPVQNIGHAENTSGPVTKRGQTLEGLLVQLNHYSPHTKRDALHGIQELTTAHPDLAAEHLGTILKPCARLIIDEDATVRKTLLAFFDRLLPGLTDDQLKPFMSLLLFSTTSALTHIFPELRIDGLKVLDILLAVSPQAATEGWSSSSSSSSTTHGQRIMEAYLSILHVRGGQGAATMTPASRLVALRSFGTFLRAALLEQQRSSGDEVDVPLPTWFLASSFASKQAFEAFLASLSVDSTAPVRAWDAEPISLERHELADPEAAMAGPADLQSAIDELLQLSRSSACQSSASSLLSLLQPMLIATFLESAPSALAPSGASSGTQLQLTACAARIARDLWRACATGREQASKADVKGLKTLVDKMGAYFPFGGGNDHFAVRRDAETRELLEELDLVYCELVSLLTLSSTQDGKVAASLDRVGQHVLALLERDNGLPTLSAVAYAGLAPIFRTLMQQEGGSAVFEALVAHFARPSPGAGVRKVALQFLEHVIELSKATDSLSLSPDAIAAFYASLPRLLYELQLRDPVLSMRILGLLHRAAVRNELASTQLDGLVPFFAVQHKERGVVKGPYSRLSDCSRQLAKGVVFFARHEGLTRALELAEA